MNERIDRNRTAEMIDRAIQAHAKDIQKKRINQEFQAKLATKQQQGANARTSELSKEVLEKYAKAQEKEKAPLNKMSKSSDEPALKKTKHSEKDQKTEQKKTQKKDLKEDQQVEQKNEKVVLDLAVQRKSQQEKDSGEFGGSSGGDFFGQAISMGMATQKAEFIASGPPSIPEEILNQIVEQVYAGVDAQGVSLFVIDLKPNVLGGGRIQISAQGKAVKLKFSGLDRVSEQSVRSARGDLRDRLNAKGLELENLEVNS